MSSSSPAPSLLTRIVEGQGGRIVRAVSHVGGVTTLSLRTFRALFTTRFEFRAFIYQLEQMGVKSFGIAAATAVFVGIVMAIQFAFSLERFGARDSVGRIVGLSEARELAPSLTALVVGSRIGAGIAAELGSMAVTEQIDAIRALGADPVKKLVVPRMLAGICLMPMLTLRTSCVCVPGPWSHQIPAAPLFQPTKLPSISDRFGPCSFTPALSQRFWPVNPRALLPMTTLRRSTTSAGK